MEQDPTAADYLDAIFAAIRAFAEEMEGSKRWLARADRTQSPAWRLTFLREARAAFDRAAPRLNTVAERLAALGSPESLPPPLDRVHKNLATMRTDLAAHGDRLRDAEGSVPPIGRA